MGEEGYSKLLVWTYIINARPVLLGGSRRVIWARHVEHTGEAKCLSTLEKLEERDHMEDLGVDE